MNTDFEKIISFVFASEEISPNDKLTRQIQSVQEDELSQEDLELVAAAGIPYYDKFKALYIDKK